MDLSKIGEREEGVTKFTSNGFRVLLGALFRTVRIALSSEKQPLLDRLKLYTKAGKQAVKNGCPCAARCKEHAGLFSKGEERGQTNSTCANHGKSITPYKYVILKVYARSKILHGTDTCWTAGLLTSRSFVFGGSCSVSFLQCTSKV